MRRTIRGMMVLVLGASCVAYLPGARASDGRSCPAHVAWTTYGYDNARSGTNPCETIIGTDNASSLHPLWKQALGGNGIAQPTYASGLLIKGFTHNVVFVTDESGLVQALDSTSGQVLWKRQLGMHHVSCSPTGGITSGLLLDLATKSGYLVDGLDVFYRISLLTGQNVAGFTPIKIGDPVLDHAYGAVTKRGNLAYVTFASWCDRGVYYGRAMSIDVTTDKLVATWKVVPPSTNAHGGGIWGPGGVSIDNTNGAVYAATGNSVPYEHKGLGERVVRLDAGLHVASSNYTPFKGLDVDYGATPVLYQPSGCPALLAAENKSGVLVVYNRDAIGAGPFQTIQVAAQGQFFRGEPAYSAADRMLLVTDPSDNGVYKHGIVGFSVASNCKLTEKWVQAAGTNPEWTAPPTVANGVVYIAASNQLLAYDVKTGAPLWNSASTIGGADYTAPLVVDGHVYGVSWDHNVYAFGP